MTEPTGQSVTLRKNALGVTTIVFLAIATNGPLAILLGGVPSAMLFGNGLGVPSVFVLMGLIYLTFSFGLAAMSRHISNAGAFYAYVAAGLGRPLAVGSGFLAIIAYLATAVCGFGMMGFFIPSLISHFTGIDVPWWIATIAAALLIGIFSRRNVEFNGRMLGALMLAEMAIILIFDLGVVVTGGPDGFVLDSFRASNVFVPGFGAATVFIIASYIGFETVAIYSEEARNPRVTIPTAMFIVVVLLTTLFSVSSWLLIVGFGSSAALSTAASDTGAMWFILTEKVLGRWAVDAMEVLMVTSLFAGVLSFQNTLSRYLFSLGRDRMIWKVFGSLDPVQQTPSFACISQTVLYVAIIAAAALGHLDPLTGLMPLAAAPASIGILAVQCLTALSSIFFFKKDHRDTNLAERFVLPLLAFVLLTIVLVLMVYNVGLLTGGSKIFDTAIPVGLVLLFAAGILHATRVERGNHLRSQPI